MADTIFALASGASPAAIAIVRLSGPAARATLAGLAGPRLPGARRLALRALHDPAGALLDRALVTWSPAPGTATGEDTAELHLHGGRAVIAAVLGTLAAMPGLRQAEPGEFARRAFAAGRLDLGEAEALADLIAAETEQQRRIALGRLDGRFGRCLEGWRTRLLALAAQIEAVIEFEDDDPLAVAPTPLPHGALADLAAEITTVLAVPPADSLRDGIRVAIAGPPNAGKSTLLNALAGRAAAIVSPIAGTTRDLIEVPVDIEGMPFVLVDTAGLRGTVDPIEREGVDRAEAAIAQADLVLWLGAPAEAPPARNLLRIGAKSDLAPPRDGTDVSISALHGDGMRHLRNLFIDRAKGMTPSPDQLSLNGRQISELRASVAALDACLDEADELLVAEAVRTALAAFDRAVGRSATEDMLDALFGSLCIGK